MKKLSFIIVGLLLVGCSDADPKTPSNNQPNTNPNITPNNTANNTTNSTNNLTLDLSQFDQTCEFDVECSAVTERPCGYGCPDGGIRLDQMGFYNEAVFELNCPDRPLEGAACAPVAASCHEGMCIIREPFEVRATDYDDSCENADDCIVVQDGEICSDCKCGGIAVNRDAFFEVAPENPQCTPEPQTCECVKLTVAECIAGTCEAVQ